MPSAQGGLGEAVTRHSEDVTADYALMSFVKPCRREDVSPYDVVGGSVADDRATVGAKP